MSYHLSRGSTPRWRVVDDEDGAAVVTSGGFARLA
eukprot:CAMPEP_0205957728 /NCGR_PEP_ID=MMETSP1459-20131121/45610_1 /ASSEMBLY_ACC=CAM_ASM_001120 /TAXON_ID=41880 /ORGANISM="Pycnococcus provasolii, Strain RCC931" /LENGTH=34 /DNA_ID= /DNA_START= /DNA_END= /DNA_ORIENTATION=